MELLQIDTKNKLPTPALRASEHTVIQKKLVEVKWKDLCEAFLPKHLMYRLLFLGDMSAFQGAVCHCMESLNLYREISFFTICRCLSSQWRIVVWV